jgi:hypothetical protein
LSENPGAVLPATMRVMWSCVPIQRESRRRIPIDKVYLRQAQRRKAAAGKSFSRGKCC